jgi:hypothetical protein
VRKGAWKMRVTSHEKCSTRMGSLHLEYQGDNNPLTFSAVSGNINLKKTTNVHPVVYQLEIKTIIR